MQTLKLYAELIHAELKSSTTKIDELIPCKYSM